MATHGLRISREARPQGVTLALCAGATALIAAWLATRLCGEFFGPRSEHMAAHILVMNGVAPLAALGMARGFPASLDANRALVAGFTLQIAAFFAWHLPGVVDARPVAQASLHGGLGIHAGLHAALFGGALLFWQAIYALEPAQRWRGFVALMVTGKLACLLGALLLFSPRLLYGDTGAADAALDDQRMAGLLMLAACPLCYLVSAIAIAAKWLRDIEAGATRAHRPIFGSS